MSTSAEPSVAPSKQGKRKRTGKQREERKKAAIEQAKALAQDSLLPTSDGVAQSEELQDGVEATLADASSSTPTSSPSVNFDNVAARIPQALKTLHPIFKQAKTFETQRLIKKVKFLRTKTDAQDEVKDLENQLQLLSHVQTASLAQTHLLQKLQKHPLVKSNHLQLPPIVVFPLTPSTSVDVPASTSSTPSLIVKVENRLCSSKPVAEGIKPVLSWLIGEQGATLISRAVVKQRKKVAEAGKAKMEVARQERLKLIEDARALERSGEVFDDDQDSDRDSDPNLSAEDQDGDVESDTNAMGLEDQAADAAGWESGSITDGDLDKSNDESDHSEAESSSPSISQPIPKRSKGSIPKTSAPTIKPTTKAKPLPRAPPLSSENITSSTFLPTLATGFTRGGDSDSDPDMDYDPDGIIGTSKAERKNRRGQRARQAIWEKKYGKNAKHVVKAHIEELNKARGGGSGWGTKRDTNGGPVAPLPPQAFNATVTRNTQNERGGTASRGRGRGGFSGTMSTRPPMGGAPLTSSIAPPTKSVPPSNPPAASGNALHPSWEAARLRRQKEMGIAPGGGAAPKPTKIVFD